MGKRPSHLLPKSRKTAIHFLKPVVVRTTLYGETVMHETACGQKLDAKGWQTQVATEPHRVTCAECWNAANPVTPTNWS